MFEERMMPLVKAVELPNRVTLPYAEQGDPAGVPMLFLHGFTDSWRAFELVLPHLRKSIRAIAMTQRGHGDASCPATGYRIRDFAADLTAFMDALRLGAAVIVGDSMGGVVAQRFAIDHPERTLGLVLIGSPVTLRGKPRVLELWRSTISKLVDPVDPAFVREFLASMPFQPVPPAFFETMLQESLKVPARVWREVNESLLADDHSGELHKIMAPTLMLWGDQDALTRTDQETLAAAIASSRLVVYTGAGHALCWEEPDRIAADLAGFVEDVLPQTFEVAQGPEGPGRNRQ
jgi:non-heme chloroperoxidase